MNWTNILLVTLYGAAAGVLGTAFGGLLSKFINIKNHRLISVILEFSGGFMLAIICFEMLPEAMESMEAAYPSNTPASLALTVAGLTAGLLFTLLAQHFVRHKHTNPALDLSHSHGHIDCNRNGHHCPDCAYKNDVSSTQNEEHNHDCGTDHHQPHSHFPINKNGSLFATGIVMILSIAAHNLPEGIAIGAGFSKDFSVGLAMIFMISLHNIPEGLSSIAALRSGGMKFIKSLGLVALVGVPMMIGAFIGAILGDVSELFMGVCLAFASGSMLYAVLADIIPEAKHLHNGRFSGFASIIGLVGGLVITVFLGHGHIH